MSGISIDVLDSASDETTDSGKQELVSMTKQLTKLYEEGKADYFSGELQNFQIQCPRCDRTLREHQIIIYPGLMEAEVERAKLVLNHTENRGERCDPEKDGTAWYADVVIYRQSSTER